MIIPLKYVYDLSTLKDLTINKKILNLYEIELNFDNFCLKKNNKEITLHYKNKNIKSKKTLEKYNANKIIYSFDKNELYSDSQEHDLFIFKNNLNNIFIIPSWNDIIMIFIN